MSLRRKTALTATVGAGLVGLVLAGAPSLVVPDAIARTIEDPDDIPEADTLGGPLSSVTDLETWNRGRLRFDEDALVSAGLGPFFNADSCQACHNLGAIGGAGKRDLAVFRFANLDEETGEVTMLPGGPLLSRMSVVGVDREEPTELSNLTEERNAPPVFGSGLISAIDDADILANEDPEDLDGDGISGRAHLVGNSVGRYGWKAQIPSVRAFVLDAMFNELGLTTPDDGSGFAVTTDLDLVEDPEIDDASIDDVTAYIEGLAPPPRKVAEDAAEAAAIAAGEEVFELVGCAACHIPELPSALGPVALYSDLLLHDVAPEGMVGIPDGDAGGREFRTPPMWGLRFSAPYLHNGSAETIHDAILAHFAESEESRQAYEDLSESEQADLLAFLGSL